MSRVEIRAQKQKYAGVEAGSLGYSAVDEALVSEKGKKTRGQQIKPFTGTQAAVPGRCIRKSGWRQRAGLGTMDWCNRHKELNAGALACNAITVGKGPLFKWLMGPASRATLLVASEGIKRGQKKALVIHT